MIKAERKKKKIASWVNQPVKVGRALYWLVCFSKECSRLNPLLSLRIGYPRRAVSPWPKKVKNIIIYRKKKNNLEINYLMQIIRKIKLKVKAGQQKVEVLQ